MADQVNVRWPSWSKEIKHQCQTSQKPACQQQHSVQWREHGALITGVCKGAWTPRGSRPGYWNCCTRWFTVLSLTWPCKSVARSSAWLDRLRPPAHRHCLPVLVIGLCHTDEHRINTHSLYGWSALSDSAYVLVHCYQWTGILVNKIIYSTDWPNLTFKAANYQQHVRPCPYPCYRRDITLSGWKRR